MQVITIDVGRSGVKVVSGDHEKFFPSKVGEARDMKGQAREGLDGKINVFHSTDYILKQTTINMDYP